MKVVLVTGGFDPLHSGHIAIFNRARELGDKLVIGLNSDAWLERKKGKAFMPFNERQTILQSLHMVDMVIAFDDSDDTAKDAIKKGATPEQASAESGATKASAKKVHDKSQTVTTVTHEGKDYVLDGHHAALGAALRGEKTITTKHLDLDKF